MVLRVGKNLTIDNLRHYPDETVDQLRALLGTGALAQADPRREGFYELENCTRVFYIHISPVSGKVLLLATWAKDKPAAAAPLDRQSAA